MTNQMKQSNDKIMDKFNEIFPNIRIFKMSDLDTVEKSIHQQASELFNNLSFEDRRDKAGLGYSLAQLTTIMQIRQRNKEVWKSQDKKLLDWKKNIERTITVDFLNKTNPTTNRNGEEEL